VRLRIELSGCGEQIFDSKGAVEDGIRRSRQLEAFKTDRIFSWQAGSALRPKLSRNIPLAERIDEPRPLFLERLRNG
jgi:hypothetical protein